MSRTDVYEMYVVGDRKHSPRGIAAFVIGCVSALILLVLTIVSSANSGTSGQWAGALGITAFAFAFYGMVQGLRSFEDRCRSYIFSKVGTVICGIMVAAWFLLLCIGLS